VAAYPRVLRKIRGVMASKVSERSSGFRKRVPGFAKPLPSKPPLAEKAHDFLNEKEHLQIVFRLLTVID
jgi:hypothetical protein